MRKIVASHDVQLDISEARRFTVTGEDMNCKVHLPLNPSQFPGSYGYAILVSENTITLKESLISRLAIKNNGN